MKNLCSKIFSKSMNAVMVYVKIAINNIYTLSCKKESKAFNQLALIRNAKLLFHDNFGNNLYLQKPLISSLDLKRNHLSIYAMMLNFVQALTAKWFVN